jgi:hypothetical protein
MAVSSELAGKVRSEAPTDMTSSSGVGTTRAACTASTVSTDAGACHQ